MADNYIEKKMEEFRSKGQTLPLKSTDRTTLLNRVHDVVRKTISNIEEKK